MATPVPFPISSAPGIEPQEGSGRLINCFAVKNEQGARFPVVWLRNAGLLQLIELGHVHLRGAILVGPNLLVCMDERVYVVTAAGDVFSATNLGALVGIGPVTTAKNNASTPDIVAVTIADGAFSLFTGSAPITFADPDLPQPNSVAELDGFLIFTIGDGRIYATELNSVDVLTDSFAEEHSVDGLLRGVTHKGEFFAFGRSGSAVYKDVGSSPFPLQRQFSIEKGIIGTFAVAGWEEGWIKELIWVADDAIVYRMNGYTPEAIASDHVVRDIAQAVRDEQGASLEASVYMHGKYAFWRLTNPGVWTWEYNASTGNWGERVSYNRLDCRASSSVRAFNRWVIGDRETGKLFEVDPLYYREGSDPLVWRLRSGAVAAFPSRLAVPRLDLDFTAAVGMAAGEDPIQTDPMVLVKWSRDGGHTFGNPIARGLGMQGQADKRVIVNRLGATGPRGMVIDLAVSDPVHVGFMGGNITVEQRSE